MQATYRKKFSQKRYFGELTVSEDSIQFSGTRKTFFMRDDVVKFAVDASQIERIETYSPRNVSVTTVDAPRDLLFELGEFAKSAVLGGLRFDLFGMYRPWVSSMAKELSREQRLGSSGQGLLEVFRGQVAHSAQLAGKVVESHGLRSLSSSNKMLIKYGVFFFVLLVILVALYVVSTRI